jgi:hypothetical protein
MVPVEKPYLSEALRVYAEKRNINLSPPSAVFYNERISQLFVRAPKDELDKFELVVKELNTTP